MTTLKDLYGIKFRLVGEDRVSNEDVYKLQQRLIRLGINWYKSPQSHIKHQNAWKGNIPKYTTKRMFTISVNGFINVFTADEYEQSNLPEVSHKELLDIITKAELNSFGDEYFEGKQVDVNDNKSIAQDDLLKQYKQKVKSLAKSTTVTYLGVTDAAKLLSQLFEDKVKIVNDDNPMLSDK